MPFLTDVCFKEISYVNRGDVSGNSVEHPYSILATESVSGQHLSMCSYREDEKTKLTMLIIFAC